MGNKMSDAVREVVVQIAERTGFKTVLKHDGTDEFVKNLMFKMPNSPHPLYIRKEGATTNDAGMPAYFQVAVHPDIFQAKFVEPSKGVEELLNTRTKQNLFSSSNYRGFPVYPSNKVIRQQ
jgi:hypothetical protein